MYLEGKCYDTSSDVRYRKLSVGEFEILSVPYFISYSSDVFPKFHDQRVGWVIYTRSYGNKSSEVISYISVEFMLYISETVSSPSSWIDAMNDVIARYTCTQSCHPSKPGLHREWVS
jgi:hypothetical protein